MSQLLCASTKAWMPAPALTTQLLLLQVHGIARACADLAKGETCCRWLND